MPEPTIRAYTERATPRGPAGGRWFGQPKPDEARRFVVKVDGETVLEVAIEHHHGAAWVFVEERGRGWKPYRYFRHYGQKGGRLIVREGK